MKHSKWLAKLGGWGYDLLILLNRLVNFISVNILRRGKISLSKKIKSGVKQAIKFVDDFEQTAVEIAIDNGYDYVACGHIHQPVIKEVITAKGKVTYLNSGDWVENLTALEYVDGDWKIFSFLTDMGYDKKSDPMDMDEVDAIMTPKIEHIYEDIVRHTGNG